MSESTDLKKITIDIKEDSKSDPNINIKDRVIVSLKLIY